MQQQFDSTLDKIGTSGEFLGRLVRSIIKHFKNISLFVVFILIFGISTFVSKFFTSLAGKKQAQSKQF